MPNIEEATDMNRVIAENLRALRAQAQLSLGEVSERTGVSKSMLGQIERGESSPTISTLWKIATGLNVSFTSLMERSEQGITIVNEADMTPLLNDRGHFRLYPIFKVRPGRDFEMLDLELDPGSVSDSSAHADGTEEFVLVYQGALEITLGSAGRERYTVPRGSAIHYRGDQPHTYRSASDALTRAVMVIHYPKK